MPHKKCKVCGTPFYAFPNKGKRGIYCSRKCFATDKQNHWISFKCDNCGKEVKRPRWRHTTQPMKHRFCSLRCYGKYVSNHWHEYPLNKRKYRSRADGILTKENIEREYASGMRIIDIAKKYNLTYGIVQKRMRINGIKTRRGRYTKNLSESHFRRMLNKKFNHTCQNCGWNKDTCDVHHRVPKSQGGEWTEENLILVCPNCHRLIHSGKLKI